MNVIGSRISRLSIGLPVYNGERLLAKTLSSLLEQSFEDFELVIADNASNDGTRQICEEYAARDRRIRYVRNERNLGAVPNFNRTVALAEAPFFKWAAHDDLYAPTYLEECMKILDHDPNVVLAHSDCVFIGEDGEEFAWDVANDGYIDPLTGLCQRPDSLQIGDSAQPVRRFWQVLSGALWATHMFGVMRRSALDKTQLLANFASSDRALLAELSLIGRFRCCPERLFMKRFHRQVSWALSQRELKSFLSTGDKAYSRRARQLRAFYSAATDKPISATEKIVCGAMVSAHCLKVLCQALTLKDARNAARARIWRQQVPTS